MARSVLIAIFLAAGLSAQQGVISGIVRNAWSKAPLRRAVVTLSTTGSPPLDAVVYSDTNGAFAFTGIPPGDYFLCSEYRAYQRACYGSDDPGQPSQAISVAPAQSQRVILPMLPLGSISGTVIDLDGDPVEGAEVAMLRPIYERRRLAWRIIATAQTNGRGEYHMAFVRPGKYRFMATRNYAPATRVQPDVTNGQTPVAEMYAACFYPNAEQIGGSAILTLNAGNDLKGIDFTLVPKPQAIVAGKVVPPPGATDVVILTLAPLLEGFNTLQFGTLRTNASAPEYRFQFPMVSAGAYRLTASLNGEDHVARASQEIQAGSNTGDLLLPLADGTPLQGKLALLGTALKDAGPYKVRLTPGDSQFTGRSSPEADVSDDGTFQFDHVAPGVWDIDVDPLPPGSYLKSMRFGDQDVLTEEMLLGPGQRPPLNLVVDAAGAAIKGAVYESGPPNPKRAGRARILLAPSGKFEDVVSFYRQTISKPNGEFEFKSVTPGRYKIFAFDKMMDNDYQNPDFLKPYSDREPEFEAAPAARLNRDVILILRGPEGAN